MFPAVLRSNQRPRCDFFSCLSERSLRGRRKLVFLVSFNLLLFSPQVRTRVLEISPFALTNPRRCLLCRLQRLCLGPFVGGNSLSLTRKQTRLAEVDDNYPKGHWSRAVLRVWSLGSNF